MKKFFRMFGAAALVAGMLVAGGCGGNGSSTPQGKVVKGPVVGATVKDSKGVTVGTTDANGNFPMTGTAPYYSTGGTYVPLKTDGTAGTAVAAPPMSCPAGVSQITPLSTLVNQATITAATGTAADKTMLANLLAVINNNGGLNTDLSVKTTANAALLNLSETVGAVLATVSTNSPTNMSDAQTAMIAAVVSLSTAPMTPALILTAVTQKVNDELLSTNPTLAGQINAAASDASEGADAAHVGPMPIPTGSTGSAGGTIIK